MTLKYDNKYGIKKLLKLNLIAIDNWVMELLGQLYLN